MRSGWATTSAWPGGAWCRRRRRNWRRGRTEPNGSSWSARSLFGAQRKRLARAGLGLRYQGLELRVARKQLVDEAIVLLRIERLNGQQSLIGHFHDNCLPRLGALIER